MKRLFGTDGIRGVAGEWPLVSGFVRRLGQFAGQALGRHVNGQRSILVVRDTRQSGPSLQEALSQGLHEAGFDVIDGGVLPTPSVPALIQSRSLTAGAVISASHNPAQFNGIKFFNGTGTKLKEEMEIEIERKVLQDDKDSQVKSLQKKNGHSRTRFAKVDKSVSSEYVKFLLRTWPQNMNLHGFRLVLDCANGAASFIAKSLFSALGADVFILSAKPNGRNINLGCGALHTEKLAEEVKRRKAHLGVAFDGDCDRAIFVDEQGRKQDGDSVLLLAARFLKAQGCLTKNTVVVTIMTNLGLIRALDALDIQTVQTPVGDKYVWEALEKTGAVLGGESSGHIIFRDYLSTGDGFLTALQVLRILRASNSPFSSLASLAVHYPQILVNVPMREKKPVSAITGFDQKRKEIEGVLGKAGRVLIRHSGTEPLLRIMVEGPDSAQVREYADTLAEIVKKQTCK